MRAILGFLLIIVPTFFSNEIRANEPTVPPKRPNLIFLMTDNQRWDALGCYGNSIIQTPNIDRLAARGLRFTNAFCTTSICAATRASILTGQYRRTHGYSFEKPPMTIAAMRKTYPAVLKNAGYRTGFVGKIGVRLNRGTAEEMFDFFRFNQASGTNQPYYRKSPDGTIKHLTQINGDQAVDFLRSSIAKQPFCLSVSFSAPHFEQLPEFLRVSMNRQRWFRRFDTPEKYQEMMKAMYRLITGVDIQIGRILDEIRKRGVEDNTLIVFTSDNGLITGEHSITGIWLMYEPSIRLPLIIYDPRRPKASRGQVVSELALNVDYGPTLLDLAGIEIPAAMQGRSLVPLLTGNSQDWPRDFFYEHYFRPSGLKTNENNIPRSEGLRSKRWKYVHYFDERPTYEQLFDLAKDPHEVNNLADNPRHYETLEAMRRRMQTLRAQAGPPWNPRR